MRKKISKSLKILLNIVLFELSFFLIFFLTNGILENNEINNKIEAFTSNGVLVNTVEKTNNKVYYYEVSRETLDDDIVDNRASLKDNEYGSYGDILTTKSTPFLNSFIGDFVSYFFGGHAAGVIENYDKRMVIESAGNGEEKCVELVQNNWIDSTYRESFIGLRIKNLTIDEANAFTNEMRDKIGIPYNFTFIFNTNKSYYCSDLVARCYKSVNKKYNLNKDGFVTTINDLILSDITYINCYKKTDNNGDVHIYYLEGNE